MLVRLRGDRGVSGWVAWTEARGEESRDALHGAGQSVRTHGCMHDWMFVKKQREACSHPISSCLHALWVHDRCHCLTCTFIVSTVTQHDLMSCAVIVSTRHISVVDFL